MFWKTGTMQCCGMGDLTVKGDFFCTLEERTGALTSVDCDLNTVSQFKNILYPQ